MLDIVRSFGRIDKSVNNQAHKYLSVMLNIVSSMTVFSSFSCIHGTQGRREHYKSGAGAHRLRGSLTGFLEVRLST